MNKVVVLLDMLDRLDALVEEIGAQATVFPEYNDDLALYNETKPEVEQITMAHLNNLIRGIEPLLGR